MRVAAQVILSYVVILVLCAVWRLLPLSSMPDVVALFAVYLGLTARTRLAPSVLGAVVLGYLADLLMGTPGGMLSLVAGVVCLLGHLVHRRLLVRGGLFIMVFSAATALGAGLVLIAVRAAVGVGPASLGAEMQVLLWSAALSAPAGPLVFRLCRLVDARFARTLRERTAALEGLIP